MARIRYLTQDASKLRLRKFFLLMPRVPCTEGGPGQSQANVPINHENAWASDLCFGISPRGTAKKLLKSLVAPVAAFFGSAAESKGMNHLDLFYQQHVCFFSNCLHARRGRAFAFPQSAGSLARRLPKDPLHWDFGRRTGPPDASSNSFIHDSNLVDPASSHTLVSKIKPCMSKYKQLIL